MRDFSSQSPEARRKRLASMRAAFGPDVERKLRPRQTAMVEVKDGDKTPINFKFKASDAKSGN